MENLLFLHHAFEVGLISLAFLFLSLDCRRNQQKFLTYPSVDTDACANYTQY